MAGVGRLAPGVQVSNAEANLAALARTFAGLHPDDGLIGLTASPRVELDPDRRAALSRMLGLLAAVSALVLAIVCANLANLMMVRATARTQEIGIRLSLGATRLDLFRQLMAEAIVISAAGATLGLLIATWTAGVLKRSLPVMLETGTRPDARVFLFVVGLSLVCATAFGLYPALRAARSSAASLIQGSGRVVAGRSRLRSGLVVGQIALSVIALVTAGLFVRTLFHVSALPLGYDLDDRIGIGINLRPYRYDEESATLFFQQLQQRVAALPGVASVAIVGDAPLGGGRSSGTNELDGVVGELELNDVSVSASYFNTMGVRIESGRIFGQSDRDVVVVNRALAAHYWPNQNAVGKRMRSGARGRWRTVIGVVNDTRHYSVLEPPVPMIYRPFAESPDTREIGRASCR